MPQFTKALLLFLLMPVFAPAKFVTGEKVPLDRMIANVKSQFREYENKAEAHYLLGRLESLAFSGEADSVAVFRHEGERQLPQVAFWSWVHEQSEAPPQAPLSANAVDLFFSSVEHYRQAIALDSREALYYFSLGWMAEQA